MTRSHRTTSSRPPRAASLVVPLDPEPPRPPRRRHRKAVAAVVAAVGFLAGGGTAAAGGAHKTVTLDVDGRVTELTTFAGSVEGLLTAQGVRLSGHDVVAPALGARLRSGDDVVVRFGRQLTFESGGDQRPVWVAALDAGEALDQLASRGADVRLVASRSGDRLTIPLRLAADGGAVVVRADDRSRTVADTGEGVEAVLAAADVTVDADDLVSVEPAGTSSGAQVVLRVQRVVTENRETTTPVPFARVEQKDPQRFVDRGPRVVQAGVDGVRTRTERVTTVDGVETARTLVSEEVTTAPVDEVVAVGTRERPVAPPVAAAQQPARSSRATAAPATARATAPPAAPATTPPAAPATTPPAAPSGDVWAALAQCESGGRADAVSSNGLYHGLYQFSLGTWRAMGGSGLPSQASPAEQTSRAQALQARSGWGQWPACARRLGLR